VQLAELLVALVLAAGVMAIAYAGLEQAQRAYAYAAARVETQQGARLALERLAAEIRTAGYGRASGPTPPVTLAEPQRIVLWRDRNDDGSASASGETVTWRLAGGVLRRDAGGGAQPVVNGVRELGFVYLDGEGLETAVLERIRSVDVTLVVAPDHARPGPGLAVLTALRTTIRLRNR
jgi:type II secretory pathway component PulJ